MPTKWFVRILFIEGMPSCQKPVVVRLCAAIPGDPDVLLAPGVGRRPHRTELVPEGRELGLGSSDLVAQQDGLDVEAHQLQGPLLESGVRDAAGATRLRGA